MHSRSQPQRGSTAITMSGTSATQQPAAAQRADADPVDEVAQAFRQLETAMRRGNSSSVNGWQ